MPPRFLADSIDLASSTARLSPDETRHLSQVLRLGTGDEIAVFDGAGREFLARVDEVDRSGASVTLLDAIEPAAEPAVRLTLAQAYLKGDKMDDVVRDAVMLGFAAVQPIVTARAETSLAALMRSARHERWHRIAVSSAKQCGRAVVPAIAPPIAFDGPTSLAHLPSPQFLLVEPGASALTTAVAGVDPTAPAAATLIVGPEGGWTAEEVQRCAGHAHPLGIGALTLRADAAAMVAAAALITHWKLI